MLFFDLKSCFQSTVTDKFDVSSLTTLASLVTLVSCIVHISFKSVTSPLYLKVHLQIRPDFLTIFRCSFATLLENTNAEMYRTFSSFIFILENFVKKGHLAEPSSRCKLQVIFFLSLQLLQLKSF